MRNVPRRTLLLLIVLAAASGGCEENRLGRKAVSGTIKFNGQLLETGSIQFSPHEHVGVASGGIIDSGSYQIPGDKGLPPGKYLVRVFSPMDAAPPPQEVAVPGPTASQPSGPSQPPPALERIPPEYNVDSTQVIEVTADGDNVFDWDIPG